MKSKTDTELFIYSGDGLGGNGMMATSVFDYTPDQMIHFLQLPGMVEKTSPMVEKSDVIGDVSQDAKIFYLKVAKVLLVASRDFVGYSRRYTDKNKHENVIMYSVNDEE